MRIPLKADSGVLARSVGLTEIYWARSSAHFHHLCRITGFRDAQIAYKSISTDYLKPCSPQLFITLYADVIVGNAT